MILVSAGNADTHTLVTSAAVSLLKTFNMKEYFYEVDLTWEKERKGCISSHGLSEIEVSIPSGFHKGQKSKWTPEHLLTGAASASIMNLFMKLAEETHLTVRAYQSQGFIKLEEKEGEYVPVEILIRPVVLLENEGDLTKGLRLMEQSAEGFPLRQGLTISVEVHPQFEFVNKGKYRKPQSAL